VEVGDLCEVAAREELSIFALNEIDEALFLLGLSFAHLSRFLDRGIAEDFSELNPHKAMLFSDAVLDLLELQRPAVELVFAPGIRFHMGINGLQGTAGTEE